MSFLGRRASLFPNSVLAPILANFPGLATSGYEVTSPSDPHYNCIAWAVGDNRHFWDPLHGYWPEGAPEEQTLLACEKAYETMGFTRCYDGTLESGFEKVAIFTKDGTSNSKLLHAARQRYDGTWTSKLGQSFDITHYLVEGVEGPAYGKVASFMQRPKKL